MMDLFRGEFIRLTMEEPEFLAKRQLRWQGDTEFQRLMDSAPIETYSSRTLQRWNEKNMEDGFKPERYIFSIRTLADDAVIGFLNLWVNLIHSDVMLGVGIGERELWGKGFGSDAMKLALQYAFMELGAQRVTLGLFEYNPRALRMYEKVGFRIEGCTRQDTLRDGKYYDSLWMGILREEWLSLDMNASRFG